MPCPFLASMVYLTPLLESPDDDELWQIVGDRFLEAGVPHGQAIALERKLEQSPEMAGEIQEQLDEVYLKIAQEAGISNLGDSWQLTWKKGFIEKARFYNYVDRPWHGESNPAKEIAAIGLVLENPLSQFVQRLEVQFDDFYETPSAAAAAVSALRRVCLETLHFGVHEESHGRLLLGGDPIEGYLVEDAIAKSFTTSLPALRSLGLSGESLFSKELFHEGVKEFSSAGQSVAAFNCTWFDGGANGPPFPNATRLSMALVDDTGHGEDWVISDAAGSILPRFFPKVNDLDLRRCSFWDEDVDGGVLSAVAGAAIFPQLRRLATRYWRFGCAGNTLAQVAPVYASLQELALCGPMGDEEEVASVRKMLPNITIVERSPFVDLPAFEDRSQEPHRLSFHEKRKYAPRG